MNNCNLGCACAHCVKERRQWKMTDKRTRNLYPSLNAYQEHYSLTKEAETREDLEEFAMRAYENLYYLSEQLEWVETQLKLLDMAKQEDP